MISERLSEEIAKWRKIRMLVVTAQNHLIHLRGLTKLFSPEALVQIREDLEQDWLYDPRKIDDFDEILKAMEEKKYARADEFNFNPAEHLKKYTLVDFVIGKALELGAKYGTPNGFVYRLTFKDPGSDLERILDTTSSLFVHDWKAAKIGRGEKFFMVRVPVTDPEPADPKFATVYRWVFHAIRERQASNPPAEEQVGSVGDSGT